MLPRRFCGSCGWLLVPNGRPGFPRLCPTRQFGASGYFYPEPNPSPLSLPLVAPLPADANPAVAQLATFFNETLGFCPNSVLTMQHRPAIAAAFIELNKTVMADHGRVTSALKRLVGYVSYQPNAYTREASRQALLYSRIRQHNQDQFSAAGVEIR